MLSINNLSFYFGSRPLYEKASLHIRPKNRIGLIGANGTGKSTLLRLITGEFQPDEGEISKSNDTTIGFLNQDLLSYQTDDNILSVAMQAFEKENLIHDQIEKILHELEVDYKEELIEKLAKLQEQFDALGGYTIQAQAEAILEGLGFETKDLERPLREFSGGWRMRVMLAKLLLAKPSLLLLDEPTNHLDMPSIQWIEEYLQNYEGAIIVVSHDRQFLDNTVNIIVEVTQADLVYYPGNFSFYLEEKTLRNEIQKNAFENQQSKIKQTERFIERFRSKATKARQVQSRVKSLERLDVIEDVIDASAKVNFKFNFNQHPGRHIMHLDHVSKSYGDKVILKNSHAIIERGDKIALIGANGKGKSTLLRIIAGTETIVGERKMGFNVNMAFYAQHQLESLNVNNEILEELKQAGTAKTETELRGILGCFLFSGDDAFKKIKVLSGGEKSRVALAKTLISEANFLLLDEPTNHLDMQSVNILIQALQQYEGSYVIVSHDRHFVSQTANKIWYIEDQEIKQYPGTFDEYEFWRNSIKKESAPVQKLENVKVEKKASKPVLLNSAEKKSLETELKKKRQSLEKLELEISKLENDKKLVGDNLSSESIFTNQEKLQVETNTYNRIIEKLDQKQLEWELLAEEILNLEEKN